MGPPSSTASPTARRSPGSPPRASVTSGSSPSAPTGRTWPRARATRSGSGTSNGSRSSGPHPTRRRSSPHSAPTAAGSPSQHGNTIVVRDLAAGQTRALDRAGEVAGRRRSGPAGRRSPSSHRGNPNTCRILDAQTGRERRAFGVGEGESIAWSRDGSTLAIGGMEGKIVLFSAARGERGATMDLPWIAAWRTHCSTSTRPEH